jgi:hypothetical protein
VERAPRETLEFHRLVRTEDVDLALRAMNWSRSSPMR